MKAGCTAPGEICLDLATGAGSTCCGGAGDCTAFDPAGIKCAAAATTGMKRKMVLRLGRVSNFDYSQLLHVKPQVKYVWILQLVLELLVAEDLEIVLPLIPLALSVLRDYKLI